MQFQKLMNEGYQKAFNYRSFCLICKSQRYNDEDASEKHIIGKWVAVQMNDRAFNRKVLISDISVLTDSTRARNLSRVQEGTTCLTLSESCEQQHPGRYQGIVGPVLEWPK